MSEGKKRAAKVALLVVAAIAIVAWLTYSWMVWKAVTA